jgi:cellulose biosynthesis protein BcsQ
MAAPMPPDDVSTLMTRVELDRLQYKVFDRRAGSKLESGAASGVAFATGGTGASRVFASAADSAMPAREAPQPRWNVLSPLLAIDGKDEATTEPEALRVPMLTVSAGPGGVGKTTILSSLARILSGMGESLFLVYADSQRTLPLHFGGQQVVPGRVRSFIPPERDFGELYLYAHTRDASGAAEEVGSWLPREANALAGEVNRILCEITNSEIAEQQTLGLASINLRVLVPDIHSVLSVNRDLAEMSSEQAAHTFYLLNKFDATVPFHQDVRHRLSAVLGERLLPFSIRRTDQIPEALAAGLTVVDYVPDAGVVADLKLMAQWLRNSMPRSEVTPRRRIL